MHLLQALGVDNRFGAVFGSSGRCQQNLTLGVKFRVEDVDLHQEPVELRLGQGIGAFLLQWILRCEHMER